MTIAAPSASAAYAPDEGFGSDHNLCPVDAAAAATGRICEKDQSVGQLIGKSDFEGTKTIDAACMEMDA